MKEEKNKWIKYGALFAILIMVGSATVAVLMGGLDGTDSNTATEYPFADVPGAHANFSFTNIKDGAGHLPEGVLQISSFSTNATINESMNQSFPGSNTSKVMVAYYSAGMLEYYQTETAENVSILIPGKKPVYEDYGGYSILYTNPAQRVIVGSPIVIATLANYTNDSGLAQRVVDVFSGTSAGSKDFDPILAYADDISDYEEMVVSRSVNGSGYDMLYQRSSAYENGTFQMESVIYSPSADLRSDIKTLAGTEAESVTFSVTEDDAMIKLYINSTNQLSYMTAANSLYAVINQYTNSTPSTTL